AHRRAVIPRREVDVAVGAEVEASRRTHDALSAGDVGVDERPGVGLVRPLEAQDLVQLAIDEVKVTLRVERFGPRDRYPGCARGDVSAHELAGGWPGGPLETPDHPAVGVRYGRVLATHVQVAVGAEHDHTRANAAIGSDVGGHAQELSGLF